MKLWINQRPCSKTKQTIFITFPRGSHNDFADAPHMHHFFEHALFEKNISGCSVRQYSDEHGILISGATTRDTINIKITASTSKKSAVSMLTVLNALLCEEISKKSEIFVAETLKSELMSIPSNMVKASRLTAEFAYWGEISRLKENLICKTSQKISDYNEYFNELAKNSLILVDDQTGEITRNINDFIDIDNNLMYPLRLKDVKRPLENELIPCRPQNLSSLIFGLPDLKSMDEQFALLCLSKILTRGNRCGILWDYAAESNFNIYHLLCWFQASMFDGIITFDWIAPRQNDVVKEIILRSMHKIIEQDESVYRHFNTVVSELCSEMKNIENMPVADRIDYISRGILSGYSRVENFSAILERMTLEKVSKAAFCLLQNYVLDIKADGIGSIERALK